MSEKIDDKSNITEMRRVINRHMKLYGYGHRAKLSDNDTAEIMKSLAENEWCVLAEAIIGDEERSHFTKRPREQYNIKEYIKYYSKQAHGFLKYNELGSYGFDSIEVMRKFKKHKFFTKEKFHVEKTIISPSLYANNIALRIRNYMAFVFNEIITLDITIIGRGDDDISGQQQYTFHSLGFGSSKCQPFPIYLEPLTTKNDEEIASSIESKFEETKTLLNQIRLDSFEDQLINLYGSALWSEETINSFLYKWMIIESIANDTISKFTEDDLKKYGKELDKKKSKYRFGEHYIKLKEKQTIVQLINDIRKKSDGTKGNVEIIAKTLLEENTHIKPRIKATINKLLPGRLSSETDLEDFRFDYKLRNQIVHGEINSKTFQLVKGIQAYSFVNKNCYDLLNIRLNQSNDQRNR